MNVSKSARTPLRSVLAALVLSVSFGSGLAAAQGVDATTRGATVERLATELRDRYVYPDLGRQAADAITIRAQRGAYDRSESPAAFAAQLTEHLRAVTHDKHLAVFAPGGSASPSAKPPPHSEAGVVRADRLAGGLGYIEVVSFPPLPVFKPVIDRAMQALDGSNGLVIDVRRNTGGAPASVAYLVSFLLPPGSPIPINDLVVRTPSTSTFKRESFASSPTPVTFHGKRVVVLTSSSTFSGGEEFAYDVQALKIGQIIGETTRGGANPAASIRLGSGYSAHIPFGRAENPVTKANWEGRGVVPHLSSPAPKALYLALQSLNQSPVRDISQASERRVFAPRTAPLTGSEAALRLLLQQVAAGTPDYSVMNPNAQTTTKAGLDRLQATLKRLGKLRALRFVEVNAFGGDLYAATFADGTASIAIGLTPDGKIDGWGIFDATPNKAAPSAAQ